ncbi:hypothetical protein, partial [Propionibacterium sp.]|uniref:hypothetical protein n=1 Tax=Propionibacterium sp. TaxID=1977903 RepID=UPI0039EB349D
NRDAMAAFLYRLKSTSQPVNQADPAQGQVTVAPNAVVASAVDVAAVTGSTPTSITAPQGTKLASLTPGQVVVAGITPSTPQGLLTKIDAVTTHADGSATLATEPAQLTDVITHTSTPIDADMTQTSASFTPADGTTETMQRSRAADPTFQKTFTWEQKLSLPTAASPSPTSGPSPSATPSGPQISGQGSVDASITGSVGASAHVKLNVDWAGLHTAGVTVTPFVSSEKKLVASGQISVKQTFPVASISRIFDIQIGPVPVVITSDSTVSATVSATGAASLNLDDSTKVHSDHGFLYDNNNFQLINTTPVSTQSSTLTVDASISAKASLDFDETLKLYGIAGITAGFGPYATAAITTSTTNGKPSWDCPVTIGVKAHMGVLAQLSIWGFTLADWSATATDDWQLWNQQFCTNGNPPGTSTENVLASGQLGTAIWKVVGTNDGDEKLLISGGTISNVMFYQSSTDSGSAAPWFSYDAKIAEVDITGHLVLSGSMVSFLSNLSNCTMISGLTNIDTSHVTDFRRFFDVDSALSSLDLSSFDTRNVQDGYSDDASAYGASYGMSYMLSLVPSKLLVYIGQNTLLADNSILDPHGAQEFHFVHK